MRQPATARFARPLAALFLLLALSGCGEAPSDPEAAIRELIAAAEQAAQDRDLDLFRDHIAADYSDSRGNDRAAVLNRLRLLFLRYRQPKLLTRIRDIRFPAPDRAEVALWLGTADTGRLAFDSRRLELSLRRTGGDWQVLYAQWERAAPGGELLDWDQ
ncbi:hypothetical protein TspCOW1_29530 [Thiohalobacter sp. COW1]|uniref:Exoribonuclease R n=1 Tax=Thiohalobacter thiocyanaticus TaxID=585455 RepID=A0A1Z4VU82_9GAMM|nr:MULTISPECIES: hypothetical protein [Thiohalobacter]BAZ95200.1 exoribonuclease R [Thiohalobacter thiocyanaticus]BCO32850.1 hypothetical protein TspCOW1_29530 [Thiohalobacter sp. COW1]